MGFPLPVIDSVYTASKDLLVYVKSKNTLFRELNLNLSSLLTDLVTINSKRFEHDQKISLSALNLKKTGGFITLEEEADQIEKEFQILYLKHQEVCRLPSAATLHAASAQNSASTMPAMTDGVSLSIMNAIKEKDRKLSRFSKEFFNIARFSKDIVRLSRRTPRLVELLSRSTLQLTYRMVNVVELQHPSPNPAHHVIQIREILRHVSDQGVKKIVVTGPAGVGKTSLLRGFNNQLKHLTMPKDDGTVDLELDLVIWVSVSRKDGVEEIQNAIVKRLHLQDCDGLSTKDKMDAISIFLNSRRYVVIIDEIHVHTNLDSVGLHDNHPNGTVVIATKSTSITQKVDVIIEVKRLSEDDSLILFRSIYGEIEEKNKQNAQLAVVSCGGIPHNIELVARFLQETNSFPNVINILGRADITQGNEKFSDAYFPIFENLPKDVQDCLFYCTVFPLNHRIPKEYLVECWWAEGLLDVEGLQRLRGGRLEGWRILNQLIGDYWLDSFSDEYVKMPILCRHMVKKWGDSQNRVVWVGDGRLPNQARWKKATRVRATSCSFEPDAESPATSNLTTLLLQDSPDLVQIKDSFFIGMKELAIFDLFKTGITSLPTSIFGLTNLVSLYVNGCYSLNELPAEIENLKKLELLDTRGSSIRSLPVEIGKMSSLRCLRVTLGTKGCNREMRQEKVIIPLEIIRGLGKLEELIIEIGCCNRSWSEIVDDVVEEISSLKILTTLHFHFPNVQTLQKFVTASISWKNIHTTWNVSTFHSFKFSVGCCEQVQYGELKVSQVLPQKHLILCNAKDISLIDEVVKQMSTFEVVNHSRIKSLSEFELDKATELKVCAVKDCKELLSIVDGDQINDMRGGIMEGVLQKLEKLHLFGLMSLQCIWKGEFFKMSIAKLKVLTLHDCPKLTDVLSVELARALLSLEHLRVDNCCILEQIIRVETSNNLADILPKLETLEVENLPNLKTICESYTINWTSLRRITIKDCKSLQSVPLTLMVRIEELATFGVKTANSEKKWAKSEKTRFLQN
ncbi:hypothetical protein ABFS82_08G225900 [Erythranthe guttata]